MATMQSVLGRLRMLEKEAAAAPQAVDPTKKDFRFWKTQPVPSLGSLVLLLKIIIIKYTSFFFFKKPTFFP